MGQRTYSPRLLILLLAALLLMLLAIVGPAGAAPNFSAADNGKQVSVAVGEQVVVMLRGQPDSGFRWVALPDAGGVLLYRGRAFQRTSLDGHGLHALSFLVRQPGDTTLRLLYARPQEGDSAPRQIFELHVQATAQ